MSSLHGLTLGDVLREHARSWPQQTAVVDGETRLSYLDLDRRVDRLANALVELGVTQGDRVLWMGQNSFRLLEVLLASARLGAYFCPANWRQSVAEFQFVLDDLAPALVVWQEGDIGETVRAARANTGDPALWIQHDAGEYDALIDRAAPLDAAIEELSTDAADPALLMYTAAFTGRPSAAMLSHTALIGQALVIGRLADIDSTYVYLNSGPLFHIATFFSTLATFLHAGTNVFTPRVDAEEMCRLIDAEHCNGAFLMPPTRKKMKEVNASGQYDLSSLKARSHALWEQRPGGYGQTEVVGMLTFAAFGDGAIGGFGRTSPLMQMRIVDPDDNDVPTGETGEIVCRGPLVMNGYWNRPDETAHRFRNGWHHTNDLGRREADGSLTFVGPKTRMIKSAAENIYPVEVENCIRTHPAVAACVVIGTPDPTWGQRVEAVVVLQPDAIANEADIIDHCRVNIASYKKPTVVHFVTELPADPDAAFGGGGYPGMGA